jgi:hypothetical protein
LMLVKAWQVVLSDALCPLYILTIFKNIWHLGWSGLPLPS